MASILLADDGIEFDGHTPEERPLGGVESSVVALTAELTRRGHRVMVRNKCREALDHNGVEWRPIDGGDWPDSVDLYIANRGDKLIPLMPDAGRTVFWIHNPARYLMKWRYLWKLWRYKPPIVFIGDYHATTYPGWAPGGERVVIPYGMSDMFCQAGARKDPPAPRAVFTSNPLRSLDWLLRLWSERIEPAVPGAELHLFTGAATYGRVGDGKSAAMDAVLKRAEDLARGCACAVRWPRAIWWTNSPTPGVCSTGATSTKPFAWRSARPRLAVCRPWSRHWVRWLNGLLTGKRGSLPGMTNNSQRGRSNC